MDLHLLNMCLIDMWAMLSLCFITLKKILKDGPKHQEYAELNCWERLGEKYAESISSSGTSTKTLVSIV